MSGCTWREDTRDAGYHRNRWTTGRQTRWLSAVVVALVIQTAPAAVLPATLAQGGVEPVVVDSDANGLTLEWQPPAYEMVETEADGRSYLQLLMHGVAASAQAGYPELPVFATWVGLPSDADADLEILDVDTETVALPLPVLPAATFEQARASVPRSQLAAVPQASQSIRVARSSVYERDEWYPSSVAELDAPQELRGHRLAALRIYPLRVNPDDGRLQVVRSLRLHITFSQSAPSDESLSGQAQEETPFQRAMRAALLNPDAAGWSSEVDMETEAAVMPVAASASKTRKITVDEAGLYQITYDDLKAAGLPVTTLDPRTFQLSHGYPRQAVAIRVEGKSDGVFQSGDRILFYADPQFSRYVDHDVYFLSYGEAYGTRISSRTGSPSGLSVGTAWRTVMAELSRYYDPLYPDHNGDHWYWDDLRQPDHTSDTYTLTVPTPLSASSTPRGSLTVWLQGYTDPSSNPDHRVRVALNGTVLGETKWDGAQPVRAAFKVPATILLNGQNTLRLSLPGAGVTVEGSWFDAVSLRYAVGQAGSGQLLVEGDTGKKRYTLTGWSSSSVLVYEVTDPTSPRRVTSYQLSGGVLKWGDIDNTSAVYLLTTASGLKSPLAITRPKALSDPSAGADYVIIAHPSLLAAVNQLAQRRTAQGLRVAKVDVEAIYDTYGAGRMDAEAIRTFLQHAYASWTAPPPSFVLLVGDGSYDFKDYTGKEVPTLVPPYLAPVDPWWGETASDNRLVTFGAVNLPSLMIGRLPVNTATEAAAVVDKIIKYETSPFPGDWNKKHVFVADKPDGAGNSFYAEADQLYNMVHSPAVGRRLYYGAGSKSYYYPVAKVAQLRADLLSQWNSGAGLATYFGHSSWLQWSTDALFHVDSVGQLNNTRRLPVVLEMTCFTSYFIHPLYPETLDEELVRRADAGAVGAWGSSGLGVATGHGHLSDGFYEAVTKYGKTNLGAAVLAGKLQLYATGANLDLLDTYLLLGDPGLTLNFSDLPPAQRVYLPVVIH